MYTGFVSEIGEVLESTKGHLVVRAPESVGKMDIGRSINVSGVCLSVTALEGEHFRAALSEETSRRTTLRELSSGARVNLEVPLAAGDGLDGHLVQGHVDAVGKVTRVTREGVGLHVWIRPPDRLIPDLVPKGSVAVDGVSLTIAEVVRDRFSVALIPSTLADTTLSETNVGQRVNLETDLIGKLVRRNGVHGPKAIARAVRHSPWAGEVRGRRGVEQVVSQFGVGGVVLVWDPEVENEGDVICAGAKVRPETFAFILTEVCGYPCVPCDRERLDRLQIPQLPGEGDAQGTAFCMPVDLASNSGTGVSAVERAATVRRLADPDARPSDFTRPGHVITLAADPGGIRKRAGHTEITVALCEAAKLPTVGVCCEVMARDGRMAGYDKLERLALDWGVPLISTTELVEHL